LIRKRSTAKEKEYSARLQLDDVNKEEVEPKGIKEVKHLGKGMGKGKKTTK
jgi:hypothetical protein